MSFVISESCGLFIILKYEENLQTFSVILIYFHIKSFILNVSFLKTYIIIFTLFWHKEHCPDLALFSLSLFLFHSLADHV